MDEHYCPMCGAQHGGAVEQQAEIAAVAEMTSAEAQVRIAEIEADKAIRLAKIQAGIMADEVVVEAAVEAAHAEGEAAGLREALAPEPVVEAVPAPPVIIDNTDVDVAPEVEAPPEHHNAPDPPSRKKSSGLAF